MTDKVNDIDLAEKVGSLDSDVKNLEKSFKSFTTRFETLTDNLFSRLEEHQKETAPKPVSMPMVLSMAVSLIAILGGMFATVIYISNSSNAPLMTHQTQMLDTMNKIIEQQTQLNSDIQLTNKETTVVKNQAESNDATNRWMIFEENLPKQITETKKDIEMIKYRLNFLEGGK